MTSPSANFSDEFFIASFAHIHGARIDAAHFVPQSGLLSLSLFIHRRIFLGIGFGPIATHIGFLPELPLGRASSDHALLAALRAHIVGSTIREIFNEDAALWIVTENTSTDAPHSPFPARLEFQPGRQGKARILLANGPIIEWPSSTNSGSALPLTPDNSKNLEEQGRLLLQISNQFCIESLRRDLLSNVRKRILRLERRIAAVNQDLARLDHLPHLQKIGTLLLSQGQTIPRGTKQAKFVDWETNQEIVVELAPDKPARSQAAEFFQKARRLQRGAEMMHKRREETMKELEIIQPWASILLQAPPDWTILQDIAQQLKNAGLIHSNVDAKAIPKRSEKNERKPYHTFYSANRREIWVGKSGKDNDQLVTRLARPHDLWLHAKNIPGAHVIVPLDKQHPCPPDVLVDAATLAAHFSNARHEPQCEVSYIERRYVRKPKKSAPGSVTTHHEKVIDVRIEKDRLARLLSSKLETR